MLLLGCLAQSVERIRGGSRVPNRIEVGRRNVVVVANLANFALELADVAVLLVDDLLEQQRLTLLLSRQDLLLLRGRSLLEECDGGVQLGNELLHAPFVLDQGVLLGRESRDSLAQLVALVLELLVHAEHCLEVALQSAQLGLCSLRSLAQSVPLGLFGVLVEQCVPLVQKLLQLGHNRVFLAQLVLDRAQIHTERLTTGLVLAHHGLLVAQILKKEVNVPLKLHLFVFKNPGCLLRLRHLVEH